MFRGAEDGSRRLRRSLPFECYLPETSSFKLQASKLLEFPQRILQVYSYEGV